MCHDKRGRKEQLLAPSGTEASGRRCPQGHSRSSYEACVQGTCAETQYSSVFEREWIHLSSCSLVASDSVNPPAALTVGARVLTLLRREHRNGTVFVLYSTQYCYAALKQCRFSMRGGTAPQKVGQLQQSCGLTCIQAWRDRDCAQYASHFALKLKMHTMGPKPLERSEQHCMKHTVSYKQVQLSCRNNIAQLSLTSIHALLFSS